MKQEVSQLEIVADTVYPCGSFADGPFIFDKGRL